MGETATDEKLEPNRWYSGGVDGSVHPSFMEPKWDAAGWGLVTTYQAPAKTLGKSRSLRPSVDEGGEGDRLQV